MPFLAGRGQSSRGYFGGGTTPDAPTSLSSVPGNGQLTISFTAPVFNGGLTITNYQYSINAGSTWTSISPADAISPVVITGLSNGTAYTVYLRAFNALGGGKSSVAVSTNTTPYTVPSAPPISSVTTSISSPNKVTTPTMTQDENKAYFSWSSPGADNIAISVSFTAAASNGESVDDYQYSTDNGATFKSAGTTSSPISITTVSGSTDGLAESTAYNVRLRAVNAAGPGTTSVNTVITTNAKVTGYTVKLYDNYPTDNTLSSTTNQTATTSEASHFKVEADWSVTVAAYNDNGTGAYSDESGTATGWRYTSYDADYAVTRACESGTGCDSCGTKTGTEDGTVSRTCRQWTRTGSTSETGLACTFDTNNNEAQSTVWNGNCRDLEASCSDSWSNVTATGTFNGVAYTAFDEYFTGAVYMYKNSCPTGLVCSGGCTTGSIYEAYRAYYCSTSLSYRVTNFGCIDDRSK